MSTTISPDALPRHYDHRGAQQRWYSYWEQQGYFHSEPEPDQQPYTIVIPPPNVTGALHLGHALNNTLQDVIIRFKRMQGYNTLWMPGTDHAGIATQAVVERRLLEEEQQTRHTLGREKLVARIWKWKDQYETRILNQLKEMGCSCDWQRTRFTLDDVCARAVRHTFFRLFRDEWIYRGKRLVNWDTYLQTAVSDDEVFHEVHQGHFWHFRYPIVDPQPGEPSHLTIATTRPETMLGDTAVAVHPDPKTELDRVQRELSEKLAAAPAKEKDAIAHQLEAIKERRESVLPGLVQLRDMASDGRTVRLPLLEREIPLVADPWAKPEMGSGCVKITPAHDPNDYEVGLRCHLPMINILNPDGTLNENAGPYQGLTIEQSREKVVEDMSRAGLLAEVEDREIDLAHSDRSKTPIEPYLADQWFVKMDRLASMAMEAVEDGRVQIFPSRYAKGYLDWLSEKRDWPVGRQLWWGHRIPIWSQMVPDRASCDQLVARLEGHPRSSTGHFVYRVDRGQDREDVSANEPSPGAAGAYASVHVCIDEANADLEQQMEKLGFQRDPDVLDTWFSSALWPHSTLGWPQPTPELEYYYPTSTLITSRDIITLWVARMVLAGLYNMQTIPFRHVYIHPKILDGYGEGMSKSKGNGIDPVDVMEKFGADALRFALTYLTTETQDVRMPVEFECPHCQAHVEQTKNNRMKPRVQCSQCKEPFATQWAEADADRVLPRAPVVSERFELGRNFCNKLWNAARFSIMNLEGFQPGPVGDDEMQIEDRWILSRLSTITDQVTGALEAYRYADAARVLYDFAWDEFCSFYVEMIKDRIRPPNPDPNAQRVLAQTLDTILRLLHPIIPFVTEEVWQLLAKAAPDRGLESPEPAAESIMIAPWPEYDRGRHDPLIEQQFSQFQSVLGSVREIRSERNIPPKAQVEFSVRCLPAVVDLLAPMEPYFQSMAAVTCTAWGPQVEPPPSCASVRQGDIEVYVDLKDFIDVEAEIARLNKERDRLLGLITQKRKKLANEQFVTRAPENVVQRERDSLAQAQSQLKSVEQKLADLRRQV